MDFNEHKMNTYQLLFASIRVKEQLKLLLEYVGATRRSSQSLLAGQSGEALCFTVLLPAIALDMHILLQLSHVLPLSAATAYM